MSKSLLDLSTLQPERPTITVDGESYELAVPDDFGLAEQAKLTRLQKAINAVRGKDGDLTDEDVAGMIGALDQLVMMLLPALPADVLGKLRDLQKVEIVQLFFRLNKAAPENPGVQAPPSTGAKRSRAYSGSTAGRRKAG